MILLKILILAVIAMSGIVTIFAIGVSIGEYQDEILREEDNKLSKKH